MGKAQTPKIKRYVSKERGKTLSFPEGKKLIGQRRLIGDEAPSGLSNPPLTGVKFASSHTKKYIGEDGGKSFYSVFETNNPVLQKFIEESKAFKGGFIFNEPTPEEMAEKAARAEQQKTLEKFRQNYAEGFLVVNENQKPEALKSLAGQIGAETTDKSGKELPAKQIAANIIALLKPNAA